MEGGVGGVGHLYPGQPEDDGVIPSGLNIELPLRQGAADPVLPALADGDPAALHPGPGAAGGAPAVAEDDTGSGGGRRAAAIGPPAGGKAQRHQRHPAQEDDLFFHIKASPFPMGFPE